MAIEVKEECMEAGLEILEVDLMNEEEEAQLLGIPVQWAVVLEMTDLAGDGVEEWVEILDVTWEEVWVME